jgi:hypothetical protein
MIETTRKKWWGAGILGVCAVWTVAAGGCQGPQPFYHGGGLVTCAVKRQECTLADPATGRCLALTAAPAPPFNTNVVTFNAHVCCDPNSGCNPDTICNTTFCPNPPDIDAPAFCQVVSSLNPTPPTGQCGPAPAGSGLAEVRVTYHSERRASRSDENNDFPLTPVDESLPKAGDPPICLDVTKTAAMNQLAPPNTDYSRATNMTSIVVNSANCAGQTPSQIIYDIVPAGIATGSGGGVTAPVTALRGQASVGQACPGGGDVCLTTALNGLQIDVADMTIAGVSLTNLQVAAARPAPLSTINDPVLGSFLGVPAGALRLRVTGKMNGADTSFNALNDTPWRVDVSSSAFRVRGQLSLNNLGPNGSALPLTITADASGVPTTAQSAACGAESSLQRLFGFEDVQRWTSTQAALSLVTSPVTQGCGALGVSGQGYIPIAGGTFTTSGLTKNAAASVDLFIPGNQPNQSYLGALQMYLSCPSGNVFNQYIGQVALTGKPQNQYSTLRFPLPAVTSSTLARPLNDCSFSFALSVNLTGHTWILDNLRFAP